MFMSRIGQDITARRIKHLPLEL